MLSGDTTSVSIDKNEWWHRIFHHLGAIYPFYDIQKPAGFSLDIEQIIRKRRQRGESVEIDPVGLACKVCLPYLLGDRTLLRDIRRVPWMSYLHGSGEWVPAVLPSHGYSRPHPDVFVAKLKEALLQEAINYVGGANKVGILLSGGMDSRIAAAVIREVQQRYGQPKEVVALTWGISNSRDVVYARKISQCFCWEFQHFPLDESQLAENIEIAGLIGAEVSPFHLHAMPKVAQLENFDVIIAGSYGDSVGRAEFSGRKVTALKPILPKNIDRFSLLRRSLLEQVIPVLKEDATGSVHFLGITDAIRRHEIEQEMHYMRRMLQACMLVIANKVPLYQMFTSPKVFGLMWGLDPAVRNDSWYFHLLNQLPGDLLNVPWARTGQLYGQKKEKQERLLSKYNDAYASLLRRDFRELIIFRTNSDLIRGLGIFNDKGLDSALQAWQKSTTATTNSLDEFFSWLSSFYVFLKFYRPNWEDKYSFSLKDTLFALRGKMTANLYVHARNWMRD